MFWLFRRKKVADKKSITPCVCDSGDKQEDSYTLHEFASFSSQRTPRSCSEGALSRFSLGEGLRKGYHRLQADGTAEEPIATPPSSANEGLPRKPAEQAQGAKASATQPSVPPTAKDCETTSSSSTDYSDDYGGYNSDSYDDEDLTCNVCDRSFYSVRLLLQHQQKKRHYGCSICDSIFPNLMALELHKETLDHWSEDELRFRDTDSEDDDDDSFYDNIYDRVARARELERLL